MGQQSSSSLRITPSPQVPQPTSSSLAFMNQSQRLVDMSSKSAAVGGPTIVTRSMSRMSQNLTESTTEEETVEEETVKERLSFTPKQLLNMFTSAVSRPSEENCSICMCDLSEPSGFSEDDVSGKEVSELKQCSHSFHLMCLEQMIGVSPSHIECPVCKTMHGVKIGNQPNGVMEVMDSDDILPGYTGCGTIVITYYFSNGTQGPEHPEPGKPYKAFAFPRQAYLPNNDRGKQVLRLLRESWKRRLTFTIGTSVTTGMQNVITWNEIHHKTSYSNFSGHGYPDPDYLDNVTLELALQGVTEESLTNGT